MTCTNPTDIVTDFGCIPTDPLGFAARIYTIALGFMGALSVLFLIIGGYQILTSGGNPDKISEGKRTIFYTLGALGLALGAGIILQVFLVDILHVPGIGK